MTKSRNTSNISTSISISGETATLNGSEIITLGSNILSRGMSIYTENGTFLKSTLPAWVKQVFVEVWGAGGDGGNGLIKVSW